MASILDLLTQSQSGKEVTANALFEAARGAMLFGKRSSSSGLNWFYYGGIMIVDGVLTTIANNAAALVLSASATNYIEATRAGVVSKNTTGFTAGSIPLYQVVTGTSSVTGDPVDYRAWVQPEYITGKATASVASADWTLSAAEARCNYYTVTGSIGVNRNIIVPNDWVGTVFNNTTGAFTVTVKTLSGSGVVVATVKRAILLADGTNVVRVTPDV
jgi:hypothetical protein